MRGQTLGNLLFIFGLVSGMYAACTTMDSAHEAKNELTPEQKQALAEYEAELEMGRNMAGRLLQQFKPLDNPKLAAYITKIGLVVAKASPYSERNFVFGIIDSSMVNAFAMPGGYILVSRGTLERAENEAELAGILGHEIAHVGKKHIYNSTLKKMRESEGSSKDKNQPETLEARKRPEAEKSETASALATYIGGSVGGQFNILSAVRGGFSFLLEDGLDPKMENEADLEGVSYAMAAGYEPRALIEYFKRVLDKKETKATAILEKTHPSIDSRIQLVSGYLDKNVPESYRGASGKERFEKEMEALPQKGKSSP